MNASDLAKMQQYGWIESPRARSLEFLWRVLHGKQYDDLPYDFNQEQETGGGYIPLRNRRPSVRYKLAKTVVRKTVAMMFTGRHWPQVATDDQDFTDWLDEFFDRFNFSAFAVRVATMGSIGTVVPIFKVLKKRNDEDAQVRILLDAWNARDCTPTFAMDGDLETVMLKYLTTAEMLRAMGIEPDPEAAPGSEWWFRRKLTRTQDVTYFPTERGDKLDKNLRGIPERTEEHGLGVVPALWVRNLPTDCDDSIDGTSTFGDAIDQFIEIDYQLSQCGRGLKYNADPEVVLKEPLGKADGSGPNVTVRSTSNVIEVSEKGDAKLMEMNGSGQKVVIEFVEKLRNFALEVMRGSRKDPQRAMSHAQSGKLAEMLEDEIISLATELRNSYGKGFLIPFVQKILLALKILGVGGDVIKKLTPRLAQSISLSWGPWFEPTANDHVALQNALESAVLGGRMDIETARAQTYHSFGMVVPKTLDWEANLSVIEKITLSRNRWQLYKQAPPGAPGEEGADTGGGPALPPPAPEMEAEGENDNVPEGVDVAEEPGDAAPIEGAGDDESIYDTGGRQ